MLPHDISLTAGKKLFFASDFHLGAPNLATSHERERKIVRWLDSITDEAAYIFLLGDVFDFWFEYRHAVPRGYVRLLGKLASMVDQGIPIVMFSGNHDIWMWDYFPQELGIPVLHKPASFISAGKNFHIGHGDGLGPGDYWFKAVKKVFRNPFFQWLYARIHPNLGIGLAQSLSRRSRASSGEEEYTFMGKEEWLWQYADGLQEGNPHDYYIFGHRHLPMDLPVTNGGRYLNLGEWFHHCTYGEFDGNDLVLRAFEQPMPVLPNFEK